MKFQQLNMFFWLIENKYFQNPHTLSLCKTLWSLHKDFFFENAIILFFQSIIIL